LPQDGIPAITDPAFADDWSDADATLEDDERVVGVARGGEARAYPLGILDWHEVVNDSFGGPLLVTFCPLCGSGVTAVRRVDGEETRFGVSGKLWRNDLVMYDAKTGSLWSQILATAIRGEETGTTLDLVPSTLTTWGAWREAHPGTSVLLPPPASGTVQGDVSRNYETDPYAGYEDDRRIGISTEEFDDDRLHPKAQVVGVASDGVARAYPFQRVSEGGGVVNDRVGDLPVVVSVDAADGLVAYDRRVDGETLSFRADGERHLAAGGWRWERTTGRAVDGPHEGTTLTRANGRSQMFWFAWLDFHPDTEVYGL
jgi:hypothetical protein